MIKKKFLKTARNVIDLEIKALQKLKKSLNKISNCSSKVVLCGVGKSGLVASKIAATLSSVGTPSFYLSASDSSHGDLGSITKRDVLILISYSGRSNELKNIIQYANRNKILLIGIVSKKDSILYKASDIKLLIPQFNEAGGIVPTSSTTAQLALGDALAISAMNYKKFDKLDFKKIHPAGSLGAQLKTVEDIMVTNKKIPFVDQNLRINDALKILSSKKLGILIIQDKNKKTKGIVTDGQVRRVNSKKLDFNILPIRKIMTKRPISIEKDELATKALSIMDEKKITSLAVHNKKDKLKTIGIIHIHHILHSKIT
jgi:arabinose-5-phosphate isomerase